ncbi:hypothetical protein D3C76_1203320 [compost metagenome]
MQTQLAHRQRLTHPCHRLVSGLDLAVQRHIEQVVAIASTLLGHVQRLIGMPHQGVGIFIVEGEQGHPDAGADTDLALPDRVRRGNRLEHPLQCQLQLCRVLYVTQDQHELIARKPRHRVAATQDAFQAIGHFHQQQVATGMAVAVIDRLEAIQIEHAHGQGNVFAPRELQRLIQQVRQIGPIGQTGQHVMAHSPLQGMQ